MVILSSPSGAGKTTLSKLLSRKKKFHISVSHTTRKPRIKEVNAKDYYFIKQDQFKALIKKNEFLEHAKVFNHYYGTSKSSVINNLEKGKINIQMGQYPEWDSLMHVNLIMEIEKNFKIKITNQNFSNFNSYKKILNYLLVTLNK